MGPRRESVEFVNSKQQRKASAMTIPSTGRPSESDRLNGAPNDAKLQQEHAHTLRALRRSHEELDHFVRALSHDMSANFMLLESSFSRLKRALDESSRPELGIIRMKTRGLNQDGDEVVSWFRSVMVPKGASGIGQDYFPKATNGPLTE